MSIFPAMSKKIAVVAGALVVGGMVVNNLVLKDGSPPANGWSTDIWPSQEHPMEGWRQLQECYTATVERCSVAAVTAPASITNYMRGYQALTNLKSRLAAAIPAFVDPANKPYTNYFATYTNATTLPLLTATGLLTSCQLPTNYFAYTPYLNLSGLGPCTNDTSTPYPHGFTNASTSAGGTNFPPGRSVWYDTDYGIAAFTTLCARLTTTIATPNVAVSYAGTTYSGTFKNWDPYSTAVTGLVNYFSTSNEYDHVFGYGNFYQNYPGYHYSWEDSAIWTYTASPGATNVSFNTQWYMNIKYYWPGPNADYTNEWSTYPLPTGFPLAGLGLLKEETFGATSSATSSVFGEKSATVANIGMAKEPSEYSTQPWASAKGWESKGTHRVVFIYDFTFK